MTLTVALLRRSDPKQSPESQRLTIETWLAKTQTTVDRWIGAEEAISGGADERPDLDEILVLAQAGQLKRLIVSSLERIGRKGPTTSLYVEGLHALGVEIVGVEQGGVLLLATPEGLLIARILADVAAYLLTQIGKKTKAGLNGWSLNGVRVPEGTAGAVRVSVRDSKKLGRPRWLWTPEDDAALLELTAAGIRAEQIAREGLIGVRRMARGVEETKTPCARSIHSRLEELRSGR